MNHIAFDLQLVKALPDEPGARDYFALGIRVDDRDFLENVREIERPFAAAEGHPNLAGSYQALLAEIVLTGLAGNEADKISLYDCECGCFGCWPLRVRISVSDKTVTWSDFEQPHRGPKSRASWWRYEKLGPFEFDREQYMAALAKTESELRGHPRING
jgi:hypothetical protein